MRKMIMIPRASFGGMTRNERRLGRFLRDNEGHPGGLPGGGGDNNANVSGNSGGESGNPGSGGDNPGEDFDPTAFWDSPAPETNAAPNGESAGTSQSGSGADDNSFAQQLTSQLGGLTFGESLMTPEIAAEMNEGNFANFEQRVQTQMRAAVRHALALNVQVLRPFAEQIMSQMRDEMGSTLSGRDDVDTLTRDFPAAKNPQGAPMIKSVFEQALKRTKGNRGLAVAQTKQMLRVMAGATADDLDIDVAPRGAGDNRPANPTINWLDELTGR